MAPEQTATTDAAPATTSTGDSRASTVTDGSTAAPAATTPPAAPPKYDYPAGTPVADMTPPQQAEYWREKAQKHEARVKAIGLTVEQAREMKEKADRHDALERELMSDKDKAVAEAADKAKADVVAEMAPRLVAAEFKAASAGRIDADRLAVLIEPLDLSKFLTDSGEVDTDRVARFVDGVAPAKDADEKRRGPSTHGQGARSTSTASANSVAAGRERYQSRYGQKQPTP